MRKIKLTVYGMDRYGNHKSEDIEVSVYNPIERLYRAAKFGLMRLLGHRISYHLGLSKFRYISKILHGQPQ